MQPNFFTENSPFLQHPLLTPERTAQEVEFVVTHLGLSSGARILDIGCGFGRHSIALAEYGYAVTGIDPSATMISAAQDKVSDAQLAVDFQQVRGEDFETDRLYDGAICLFTSLGQISETGDNSRLVEQVYQALRIDSTFIVEIPQCEATIQNLKPADRFGDEQTYTAITRQYDDQTQIVTETFSLVSPAGTHQFLLQYRLFSLEAITTLLTQAGFQVVETYSDYLRTPLTPDSLTQIIIAKK